MPEGVTHFLWILTPIIATMCLVLFTVAITTNEWLYSEEKIPIQTVYPNYNGSENEKYLLKFTVSGLWTLCYTEPGKTNMNCYNIDYFPKKEYSPDPHDSTTAIPYAVTRAATFYFLSTIMLMIGDSLFFIGFCYQNRRIFIFISGCTFITTGLTILAGLVIYIATFKSEVGIKLEEQSTFQPPLFTYKYGFSFLLVVSCFMASEMTGTAAIFLYINIHKKKWMHERRNDLFDKYVDCRLPVDMPPPPLSCQRHRRRRNSRFLDFYASRENSPRQSMVRAMKMNRAHSESMRDLSYYSFPVTSRDITCNTVSTMADINRDHSIEFSYENLRRTTPV